MNIDDFRCMQRGVQLFALSKQDESILAPVNLRTGGKKRALLLIHGFSSSPAVFRKLVPLLSGYDAIVCPVLPGHADSIKAFAKAKASDWFSLVEQVCEQLLSEFEELDVLGLSLGGLLAIHLSKRYPLRHLYLLAPALDLQVAVNQSLLLIKALNWLGFSAIRSNGGNLYSASACEITYRRLPLSTLVEIFTTIQQFEFAAPTCPTDLFLGCHDQVVCSWRVADRFASRDNINIHWLVNSAHVLPLDGDLETIAACIKKNL